MFCILLILKENLISVRTITDKGFTMTDHKDKCEFFNTEDALSCVGIGQNNMFKMWIVTSKPLKCNYSSKNSSKLWHGRLDHSNVSYSENTLHKGTVEVLCIEDDKGGFFVKDVSLWSWVVLFPLHVQKPKKKTGEFIHTDVILTILNMQMEVDILSSSKIIALSMRLYTFLEDFVFKGNWIVYEASASYI